MWMRNGSGDQFFILFSKFGAVINGFAHESEMNGWEEVEIVEKSFFKRVFGKKESELIQDIWNGVVENVPDEFRDFILSEPVKSVGTTFCIWRKNEDKHWKIGNIEFPKDNYGDGSADLLKILDNNPETYIKWALNYYEGNFENTKLKLETVKYIYESKMITKEIVLELKPEIEDFDVLENELKEIGYDNVKL